MSDKILSIINEYSMLQPGDTVVCGLSGGADSVYLLLMLNKLSSALGISVEALHVNHCLRGAESDRDQEFCRQLCKRLDIPFTAVSCNVKKFADENSLSDEEAARKLRYDIFKNYSSGKKLATAHNANDNLETLILNLTRGSGLKGLAGIPPVRGNIIRPILNVTRQEIISSLETLGESFVTDSTNLSDDYTRNKIRHQIIPLLTELNPSINATSVRSVSALREENSFIEAETNKAEKLCRSGCKLNGLNVFPSVVRKRCIARLLSDNSLPYSFDRLEEADHILISGGKINISGQFFLIAANGCIELEQIQKSDHQELFCPLEIGDNRLFPDKKLTCQLLLCDEMAKVEDIHKNLTFYLLDYDKIKGRAVLRNRRFGDKIQLCGRSFASSVKKLINETVPKDKRQFLHFIQDDLGTVFAECIGVAQRAAPDKSTKRLLKITVSDWSE